MLAANPTAVATVRRHVRDIAGGKTPEGLERDFAKAARQDASPAKHAMLYVSGLFAEAKGKRHLAAGQYEKAVDAKADFLPAYEALLETYRRQKRADQMDRLVAQVAATTRPAFLAHYLRGKVHLSRGETDEAVASLKEARNADPQHLPTLLLLAENDEIVDNRRLREMFELLRTESKKVRLYTGCKHSLQFERPGEVAKDIVDWMRAAPGG